MLSNIYNFVFYTWNSWNWIFGWIHTFCPDFSRCYPSWKHQFREADGNENLKDAQHLAEVMFVYVEDCWSASNAYSRHWQPQYSHKPERKTELINNS